MSELPICACGEFRLDHSPGCPVRKHIDALAARITEAEQLIQGWLTYGLGPSDDSPLVARSEEFMAGVTTHSASTDRETAI